MRLLTAGLISVWIVARFTSPQPLHAADVESSTSPSEAAVVFLDSLDEAQRGETLRPFDDPLREDWHYFPRRRSGVAINELTPDQRAALDGLLNSLLTSEGMRRTEGVITLEAVLGELHGNPDYRDAGKYYALIFGDPANAPEEPWGFRFEGHHLSLNYTVVDGQAGLAVAPAFFGADPHRVPRGEHAGLRVLAAEEDDARAFMVSLDPEQQTRALIADRAPRDILTGADAVARLDRFEGLPADALTDEQQVALRGLIDLYLDNHRPEGAQAMRDAIEAAGFDNVYFAWAGSVEPDEPHYYRVHGPTFVIEYDNIQNNTNHSHTVLRDLQNDFGRDWLSEHHEHDHNE